MSICCQDNTELVACVFCSMLFYKSVARNGCDLKKNLCVFIYLFIDALEIRVREKLRIVYYVGYFDTIPTDRLEHVHF